MLQGRPAAHHGRGPEQDQQAIDGQDSCSELTQRRRAGDEHQPKTGANIPLLGQKSQQEPRDQRRAKRGKEPDAKGVIAPKSRSQALRVSDQRRLAVI